MKYLDLDKTISDVNNKYDTVKFSGISLLIIMGIFLFFSLIVGGYMAAPVFLFIIVIILLRLRRERDEYTLLTKHGEEYRESGKYPYSKKNRLINVIEVDILRRNQHRWPVIISLFLSLLIPLISGVLNCKILFNIGFALYMIAAFYFVFFLIFIRVRGVKHARIKKRYDRSLYEDIYVELPSTFSASFYCGERAFYFAKSCQLIPYESVERLKRTVKTERRGIRSVKTTEISIYAKGEKVIKTPCDDFDTVWLVNKCIRPNNMEFVIEGFDKPSR